MDSQEQTEADFAESLLVPEEPEAEETEEDQEQTTATEDEDAEPEEVEEDDQPEGEEDEPEEDESEEVEDVVEVFNRDTGQWETVSRDEAKAGYFREADYTRKSQENAELKRALEAEQSTLTELKSQLKDALAEWAVMGNEPDWQELVQQVPPDEFLRMQVQWQQHQQQQDEAARLHKQIVEAENRNQMEREKAKLLEHFPVLNDPAKRQEVYSRMEAAALDFGFTPEEVKGATDHRLYRVLDALAELKDMKASTAKVTKRVVKAPKALKPGHRPTKQERSERLQKQKSDRLKKEQSTEALADWLLS